MCQEKKTYPCVFNFPKLRMLGLKQKEGKKKEKKTGTDDKDWYRTGKKQDFLIILCAVSFNRSLI